MTPVEVLDELERLIAELAGEASRRLALKSMDSITYRIADSRAMHAREAKLHATSMEPTKHRASYLTVPQQYALNVVCRPLASIGYGTFHVGSSLTRADYHDVDLRCMLPDEDYDRMFESDKGDGLLLLLNAAISEWIASRTGLPIDFQFQRASQANETFTGQRNAVGH